VTTALAPERAVSHQLVCDAIHESGHAVAAHQLGMAVTAVTIVPRDTVIGEMSGCVYHDWLPRPEACIGPILVADRPYREFVERSLVMILAGPAAVARWAPRSETFKPPELLDDVVARLRDEYEAASVVIEEIEAERPLERQTDQERAFRLAALGVTPNASTDLLFLSWVVAEVVHWVETREFVKPLQALTMELLHARSLTGERVHSIIERKGKDY
jgi:hypothetical protein